MTLLSTYPTAAAGTVGVDEGGIDSAANDGEKIVSKEAIEARRKREAALEAEIGKYLPISCLPCRISPISFAWQGYTNAPY